MGQILNHLDIMLPGKRPFVAPSAVVQARQRLDVEPVKRVFEQTQACGTSRHRILTGAG